MKYKANLAHMLVQGPVKWYPHTPEYPKPKRKMKKNMAHLLVRSPGKWYPYTPEYLRYLDPPGREDLHRTIRGTPLVNLALRGA